MTVKSLRSVPQRWQRHWEASGPPSSRHQWPQRLDRAGVGGATCTRRSRPEGAMLDKTKTKRPKSQFFVRPSRDLHDPRLRCEEHVPCTRMAMSTAADLTQTSTCASLARGRDPAFSVALSTQVGMARHRNISVTDRCGTFSAEPRQAHRNEDAACPSSTSLASPSTSLARPLGISTSKCLTGLRNDDSCLLKQQSSCSHSLFDARRQQTPDVALEEQTALSR